jgi:Coenzyme PQQ synthesis protein D (PqqD)
VRVLERKFLISPSVVRASLDGELFLLNIESGVYFQLDSVGSQLWELIEQGMTEDAICTHLLREYAAEPARLRADVSEFLSCLAEQGLVLQANG